MIGLDICLAGKTLQPGTVYQAACHFFSPFLVFLFSFSSLPLGCMGLLNV